MNVTDLFNVGGNILKKLPNQEVFSFTCKRNERVQTLSEETVSINKECTVKIDVSLLFQRLIIATSQGVVDLEEALKHELSPYPPALFESQTAFRSVQKSQIMHCIMDHCKDKLLQLNEPMGAHFVLDGGSLLHRVPWPKGDTYIAIAKSYAHFVTKKYGKASVIFDGYNEEKPSTKDMVHLRRSSRSKCSPTVNFSPNTIFNGKREIFLQNVSNKIRMIQLIGNELQLKKCKVIYASEDADTTIVHEGIESSKTKDTIIIGEDSDLLVLLLSRQVFTHYTLLFRSDVLKKASYDIHNIQRVLGPNLYNDLFLHSFTGCDTTSHIHGIGKSTAFKMLRNNKEFRKQAHIFCSPNRSQEEIAVAGQKAVLLLYGGKRGETLEQLRVRIFQEKVVTSKTFVKPEQLPPTSSAVKYHALRSYHQIQTWLHTDPMDPLAWGWIQRNNFYFPKFMDLPLAPPSLMTIIRCKCAKGCDTLRCSCKKMGLLCSNLCENCREVGCQNAEEAASFSGDESDIE